MTFYLFFFFIFAAVFSPTDISDKIKRHKIYSNFLCYILNLNSADVNDRHRSTKTDDVVKIFPRTLL